MKIPVSLERLDLDDMRKRLGNDDELIADLLSMFLETCPAQVEALKAAVESLESDAVRRGAHTLKGASGNLSAARIRAAAAALEDAGERGNTADFDRLFAILAGEVDGLVVELGGEAMRNR